MYAHEQERALELDNERRRVQAQVQRARAHARISLSVALLLWALVFVVLFWTFAGQARADEAGELTALREALSIEVEAALPCAGAEFELGELRLVGDLPDGGWQLELKGQLGQKVRAEVIPLAGGSARKVWVSAPLEVEVPVVVATRDVERGEGLDGAIAIEMRSLKEVSSGFYSDHSEVASLIARTRIREGDPVRPSRLEKPDLVSKDEIVTLRVIRGAIEVTDRGVAQQSGAAGELIKVQSLSTEKVLKVVVVANGLVEVP